MKLVREGSTLLMVIMITSIVAVCAINMWRSSWYATDLARTRVLYEQQWRAAEGLLNYGISVAHKNYEGLKERARLQEYTTELHVTQWPAGDGNMYDGVIGFVVDKDRVQIRSALCTHAKELCVVQCALHKEGAAFVITDWSEGA